MSKFFVDYNKSSQASTILWTHEDIKIEETEPFIDFIRCDFDGEDYKFLYQDEKDFKQLSLDNFGAVKGDEEDTFLLCYTADIELDLNQKTDFKKALDFSSNLVEVVLGFKHKGKVLKDCFEEHENRQAELKK
jgi:hypothetical protein|tara:strand:+ start:238 stop:636 length:399 start_codon:yes stop_codon:yes gene_type:complete